MSCYNTKQEIKIFVVLFFSLGEFLIKNLYSAKPNYFFSTKGWYPDIQNVTSIACSVCVHFAVLGYICWMLVFWDPLCKTFTNNCM